MAFRLSDLNAITSSIATDIFHLRNVSGLDKKITNTNLFNTIPTLTTFGTTILAKNSGEAIVGNSLGYGAAFKFQVVGAAGIDGLSPITSIIASSTGSGGWTLGANVTTLGFYSADASGAGAGVRASFSMYTTDNLGSKYGLKTYVDNGSGLVEAERLTPDGNRIIGTQTDHGYRLGAAYSPALDGSDPATIAVISTLPSSGWTVGSSFARYGFHSDDGSGAGVGIKAAIDAYNVDATQSAVGLKFMVGSPAALIEGMRLTHTKRLLIDKITDDGNTLQVGGSASIDTTLYVDTIAEKTASNNIKFSNTVQWKYYHEDTTSPTEGELFDILDSWIPTTNDFMSIEGQAQGGQFASEIITQIIRVNTVVIKIVTTVGDLNLNEGDATIAATSIEMMSNFDKLP